MHGHGAGGKGSARDAEEVNGLKEGDRFLEGKTALVAGGGGSMGEGICFSLSERGAAVILLDVDKPRGKDIETRLKREGYPALFIKGDAAKDYDVRKALERVEKERGGVDILVNNTADTPLVPIEEMSEKDWERDVGAALKGVFTALNRTLPYLRESPQGRIINVCPSFIYPGKAGRIPEATVRGALVHLTRQLALELAPLGITVNAVSPGAADTEVTRHLLRTSTDPGKAERDLLRRIPTGCLVSPREVGEAVAFLAAEGSRSITGIELVVDGGMSIT